MSYLTDWKTAKKRFEAATGKKKPSAKFLGVFNKSSGIESAVTAIDKAMDKKDAAALQKACAAFEKTVSEYCKLLAAAAKDESADYKTELAILKKTLDQIGERAAAEDLQVATDDTGVLKKLESTAPLYATLMKDVKNLLEAMQQSYDQGAAGIESLNNNVGGKAADIKTVAGETARKIKVVGAAHKQIESHVARAKAVWADIIATIKKLNLTSPKITQAKDKLDEVRSQIENDAEEAAVIAKQSLELEPMLKKAIKHMADEAKLHAAKINVFLKQVNTIRQTAFAENAQLVDKCEPLLKQFKKIRTGVEAKAAVESADKSPLLKKQGPEVLKRSKAVVDRLWAHDYIKNNTAHVAKLNQMGLSQEASDIKTAKDLVLEIDSYYESSKRAFEELQDLYNQYFHILD